MLRRHDGSATGADGSAATDANGDAVGDADESADGGTVTDGGADPAPLGRAVRWLRSVPATLAVCLLLGWVYVAELVVVVTAGPATATRWFVATPEPSPGWLLAPLAHAPADPVHLLGSLAMLVAFGGMAERRLGPRAALGLFAVGGLGGTAAQVGWYRLTAASGQTLGASGAALAAATFATVASLRTRVATGRWAGEVTRVWTLLGAAVVGRRLVLDLVVGVPAVGRVGHFVGVLLGAAVALAAVVEE